MLPVFGSTRPSILVIWPVYQSDPSLVASGSCGRDPGVDTCHALIETLAGPGITAPAGFPLFREVFGKYSLIVGTRFAGKKAPGFALNRTTGRQPPAPDPA